MAAPPKKMGLSLYANLLDTSKPDSSATATISSAPVRYDNQNAKQGGATDEAQKRKDAALQFQPVRRPAVNSKKDGAKKVGGKGGGGHMFSSSTTSASLAADSSAVGSTPSVQRSNFEDWVGDEDEDSFFLENREKAKPERGGRKNKKKKGGKGQEVVATRSWSWDDFYDPSMPNNYADYKGSEEQVMEIRDWKARLYYHRVKGGKKNTSVQETVKKAAVNSMFAPPASLGFAPPSFDQTPTKPAPPLADDDDEYYPPSVPSRLPDTSDSYEPPPAFSTPVQPRPTSMDPRRAAMPPPPPPAVVPVPPVLSEDAAAAIAAKKAEAAAKIAAFKAKVEAHKAAKAAAENGGLAAVSVASELPATPALPVTQPVVSEPVHALPPPPPPPAAAEQQEVSATISRAPVRYTAPPVPADNTTATAADIQADADEETRSNRPGQKGFAERLLKKYGWEKGKGLGAQGNEGITTAIVAKAEKRKKLADAEGGGWAKPANMGKLVGGKRRKVGDGGEGGDGEAEMSSVVRLSNMLTGLDVEVEVGEKDLYGEIGREMEGEYGKVERVFIYRRSGGVGGVGDGGEEGGDEVFVKFVSPLSALRAVGGCEGMEFAGNVVKARFWGVEDFEEGRYE
ncbi:hypothetical protein LTS10_011326 [Elasticomyces elasticus]|nr:hypothetical protein LTS10_011326 [Elasticomyces elasticus]